MLKEADVIACEDTRTSLPLLRHFGISARLVSYHAHNEKGRTEHLSPCWRRGKMSPSSPTRERRHFRPGLGNRRRCIDEEVDVTVLPGPTAFVPALVLSGLQPHPFLFHGFFRQTGEREKVLLDLAPLQCTLVFYVSPHKARSISATPRTCSETGGPPSSGRSARCTRRPEGYPGGTCGFRGGGSPGRDRPGGGRGLPAGTRR